MKETIETIGFFKVLLLFTVLQFKWNLIWNVHMMFPHNDTIQ